MSLDFCQWHITNFCNLGCSTCKIPKNETPISKSEEVEKAIKKTLHLLDETGVRQLELIGGEPTIFPQIDYVCAIVNDLSFKRLVIITSAIETTRLKRFVELTDSQKAGICVTLDFPEKIFNSPSINEERLKDIEALKGSLKKSEAGWKAFNRYSHQGYWLRGHVTIHHYNLSYVPEIARRVLNEGKIFNCCPVIVPREGQGKNHPFVFRNKSAIALRPEDKNLAEEIIGKLKDLRKEFGGDTFIPQEWYLDLIPQCCKLSHERYPISCGDKMNYLRVGPEIADDGTYKLMICSDLEFQDPLISVSKLAENPEEVMTVWKSDPCRLYCQRCEGCMWSVSFSLAPSFSKA